MPIPAEAADALRVLRSRFGAGLVAVYLYGSAVAGGLRPGSDVDLLVVVGAPMTAASRRGLAAALMQVSGLYPVGPDGRRPLEVTVFCRDRLAAPSYPTPNEFVYGEWLRAGGLAGWDGVAPPNPDHILLLAQARQQAIALLGPAPAALLPAATGADIRRAIGDARPELLASLAGDERNVLLTLARMWCTLATGRFVTKDAAARWAAPQLDAEAARLLLDAGACYLAGDIGAWQHRQPGVLHTAAALDAGVLAALAIPL